MPDAHPSFRAGLLLLDRYELKLPLGEGGMGIVWKAIDRKLEAPVAIKFLKAGDEIAARRFADEGRIAARLTTPHIARVCDRGWHEGVPFLVMEYLEGQTLRELLLIRGTLTPELVASFVEQIASGLAAVHERGIVHRDIKPANIFLLEQGGRTFIKILDFGASKIEAGEWTEAGGWLGTPHYVSPEQARDASRADPSADVWALAVVAYECLSGKKPFDGTSATAVLSAILEGKGLPLTLINSCLPPRLDAVFTSAFNREIRDRPQSASAFAEELTRAIAQSTPLLPVLSELTLDSIPRRSRRSHIWIACCLGLVLATYGGYRIGRHSGMATRDVPRLEAARSSEAEEREAEVQATLPSVLPDSSTPLPTREGQVERRKPGPSPAPDFTPKAILHQPRHAPSGGSGPVPVSSSESEQIWERRR